MDGANTTPRDRGATNLRAEPAQSQHHLSEVCHQYGQMAQRRDNGGRKTDRRPLTSTARGSRKVEGETSEGRMFTHKSSGRLMERTRYRVNANLLNHRFSTFIAHLRPHELCTPDLEPYGRIACSQIFAILLISYSWVTSRHL